MLVDMDTCKAIAITPNVALTLATLATQDTERVSKYRGASKSAKTITDYKGHWLAFDRFCQSRQLLPILPATADTVEKFIVALADGWRWPTPMPTAVEEPVSVSTIRARMAAIGYIHEIAGHGDPTKTVDIRETMKGIARNLGTAPTKKTALTIDEIRKAVGTLGDDLRGKRDRAMLLAGYFGAFRRSELVALVVSQLRFEREQTQVAIIKSKTDQEGKGKFKHLPVLTNGLVDICPTRALRAWLDASGIGSGPVFRAIDRWGHLRNEAMTGKEVARLVKRVVMSTGLSGKDFAGHSLRSGFVTDATKAGAADAEIMEQTGHTRRETVDVYRQLHGHGALSAARKVAELVR